MALKFRLQWWSYTLEQDMSHVMRNSCFLILFEKKKNAQIISVNAQADQRLLLPTVHSIIQVALFSIYPCICAGWLTVSDQFRQITDLSRHGQFDTGVYNEVHP